MQAFLHILSLGVFDSRRNFMNYITAYIIRTLISPNGENKAWVIFTAIQTVSLLLFTWKDLEVLKYYQEGVSNNYVTSLYSKS